MGGCRVDVISSKGCSKLFVGISSFRGLRSFDPMSPSSSSVASEPVVRSSGPFSGLIICVTGLSKEARKQVKDATERLGGHYSPNLHPQCTHLVVQSFGGRKLEHALKHGLRNGLFVVTLGWFVDSVRRNVRLSESLYGVKNVGENGMRLDEFNRLVGSTGPENSCLPVGIRENAKQSDMNQEPRLWSRREAKKSMESTLSGCSMYVDLDISSELRSKVVEAASKEGATFVDQWFLGCHASHVVCEGPSVGRYLGHSNNLVTPLWVLKTAKEKYVQRLVHVSADLARQVGMMLENFQNGIAKEEIKRENIPQDSLSCRSIASHEETLQIVKSAKNGVRNRRSRRMQMCQTPIRPLTPSTLLDSICWSISEPASTASLYTDSCSMEDVSELHTDAKESQASFTNISRPLAESEKTELIVKNHFLTILFPVDRFAEMGPSSKTFFSDKGFTCSQVLDHIYTFYQENMSIDEMEAAIHTDSKHADRLRSVYSSKETTEHGYVTFKRIDFLGSRKSFEMLKRVNGDNNSNVYELLIRA